MLGRARYRGRQRGSEIRNHRIGLDTELSIAESLYEETRDSKYAPPVLLRKMVTGGWLGRKAGKDFYEYRQEVRVSRLLGEEDDPRHVLEQAAGKAVLLAWLHSLPDSREVRDHACEARGGLIPEYLATF
ncbi:MAG: hypothetical protein JXL84_00245 [Deltaproteobacteria bacterium]|nr:hypothetical protein [Deltaproteobacteria bacterium]